MTLFIYIFGVSFCIILAFLTYSSSNSQLAKTYEFLGFVFIVLYFSIFFGFKFVQPYTDAYYYLKYFQDISELSDVFLGSSSWKGDYLFFFLAYLGGKFEFFLGNYSYFIPISFLSILLCTISIWTLSSPSSRMVVLVFFISTSTFVALYGNLLRQGLALSLFIFSLVFLVEKKLKTAFFIFMLSVFVHKSVLIFIFAIPLLRMSWERRRVFIVFLILLSFILSYVEIFSFMPDLVAGKVEAYANATSSTFKVKLAVLISSLFLFLLIPANITTNTFKLVVTLMAVVTCFVILFMKLELFANRFIFNAVFFMPLVLVETLVLFRQRSILFLALMPITIGYIVFFSFFSESLNSIVFNF